MAAAESNDQLAFKNLCSILKVSIMGHQVVTSVEFLPKDPSIMVSGAGKVTFVDGIPQLAMSSTGNNRVALNIPGILLKEDFATDFYLVLPPQTYKGGFTVRIQTSGGSMDKVFKEDFTMERSCLHVATPFTLKLDQGVDPSLYLEGSGTIGDPFLIGSLSDLLLMQGAVNAGGTLSATNGEAVTANSASYRLISDIDLSPVCGAESGMSWAPIGDAAVNGNLCFLGSFDGDGHTISNLYIQGENSCQGLFGLGMQDWPRITSTISRLHVIGHVEGSSQIGLVVGKGGIVSDCTTEGEVVSDNDDAGGVAGYVYAVDHCVNKASVRKTRGMVYSIGGIAGTVGNDCHDCQNEGDITSVEGYRIGGIVGYHSGLSIYNCYNSGTVTGGQQCGGIAGIAVGTLSNCLNEGNVSSGYGYCGGIAGVLDYGASILNCVNTGTVVEESYGTDNGGICGYARQDSSIEYAYYPGDIPAVPGISTPLSKDLLVFSFSKWNGEGSDIVYFNTSEGFPCCSIIDALNAWAAENRTQEKPFCGWEIDSASSAGRLTGEPPVNPAGDNGFLVSLPSSMVSGPDGGVLEIHVASSNGFSVNSAPDWVQSGQTTPFDGIPNNWKQSLSVSANPGARRSGEIILRDGNGKTLSVPITQYGRDEFDWSQSFYHRSLFFVFTCQPDSFFDPGTYEDVAILANETFPDRILHAAIFRDGALSCPQSIQMFDKNGISGWPALFLDGYIKIHNGYTELACQDVINAYRQNESRESLSSLMIQPELTGRKLKLGILGHFKKAGSYKIHVMLLEDGLNEYGRTNNHIVRTVLSSETGDPFTISEDRTEKSFTFNTDIPEKYVLDNMNVLVFIQTPITQATWMVDNAFTVPVKTR